MHDRSDSRNTEHQRFQINRLPFSHAEPANDSTDRRQTDYAIAAAGTPTWIRKQR